MITIRHLAASRNSTIVAAAEFKNTIHIWDVELGKRLSKFNSVLDYGGKRLLLSHDGRICVAASYGKDGISCYSTINGRIIWHRDDISKFQELSISADGMVIYCNIDSSYCLILNLGNGTILDKIYDVNMVYESDNRINRLLVGNCYILENKINRVKCILGNNGKSLLSAVFGDNSLCISKCNDSIYVFNMDDGHEIWNYRPPNGNHILELYYSKLSGYFYGIEFPYEKGGNSKLLEFNYEESKVRLVYQFPSFHSITVFLSSLDKALTSEGLLIDLKNGSVVKNIQFGN